MHPSSTRVCVLVLFTMVLVYSPRVPVCICFLQDDPDAGFALVEQEDTKADPTPPKPEGEAAEEE
jgi:hypothetical protein